MGDPPRHLPPAAPAAEPTAEPSTSKRTMRVQLANGAREARAYVAPTEVPGGAAHKTFEMRTVAVDANLDPRRRATVARGMGEAVEILEGDIVDPETGRVLPPAGAVPGTGSPWLDGKRPTKLGSWGVPFRSAPPTAGLPAVPSGPSPVAYVGAAVILAFALGVAFLVFRLAGFV